MEIITEKLVPILRFVEFKGEWEEKKLGDIATFSKGKGISKADIAVDGHIECIRYGELYTTYRETISHIASKTNIKREELFLSEYNDVIIPASGESQIDIATASCVLKAGVALGGDLNIIKTKVNGVFLAYYLNHRKKNDIALLAQGISVVHLYSSQLKTLKLIIPAKEEQQKIADFLTAIDDKIQQLTRKKSLLEQYKKGVMKQIFNQQIRFKDDNGKDYPDWVERTLGEVTYKVDKKNKNKEVLPVYSISNVYGFIPQSEQFDGVDSNERGYDTSLYKIVEKETFAYNPARINVGSIGYSGNLERVIVSSLYVCFKTTDLIDDQFMIYFLQTKHFKTSVLRNGEGGVRIYLFYENFSQITIQLPSIKEQTLIVDFLSTIDEKIQSVEKQIKTTQAYKKGLLQQLFV